MKPSGMIFLQSPLELSGVQNDCASDSAVDTSSSMEVVEAVRADQNTKRTYRRASGVGGRSLFRC